LRASHYKVSRHCGHLFKTAEPIEMPFALLARKDPLSTEVGLGPGHIVLDGDSAPTIKGAQTQHISAHGYCGQTAGSIKMPLGTGDLGACVHIVLDGSPSDTV